jgi:erythromycin esterase-like protein
MRAKVLDSIFCCCAVLTLSILQPVSAQYLHQLDNKQVPQQQQSQHPLSPDGSSPGKDDDVLTQHMTAELAKSRNKQRQQQLVADTVKLLDLATQLKDDVDKSNKDTLSLEVVRKAEEIEKLAKTVKEKMRNGV